MCALKKSRDSEGQKSSVLPYALLVALTQPARTQKRAESGAAKKEQCSVRSSPLSSLFPPSLVSFPRRSKSCQRAARLSNTTRQDPRRKRKPPFVLSLASHCVSSPLCFFFSSHRTTASAVVVMQINVERAHGERKVEGHGACAKRVLYAAQKSAKGAKVEKEGGTPKKISDAPFEWEIGFSTR